MIKLHHDQQKNIIPVILAGGTGMRLWPISRPDLPKQFQSIIGEHTLFQQTVLRLDAIGLSNAPIVMTNTEHLHLVTKQLIEIGFYDVEIICEPACRDTAPAILIAAMTAFKRDPHSTILTLPSDHRIHKVNSLAAALTNGSRDEKSLVAFGIKPENPATGYGYIKYDPHTDSLLKNIVAFDEKPNLETAELYLNEGGYLWNSGMYLFSSVVLIDQMQKIDPGLTHFCRAAIFKGKSQEEIFYLDNRSYEKAKKISIDHALMEKTTIAKVLEISPQWNDVGSWAGVWECSDQDDNGNVTLGNVVSSNSQNCYIRSDNKLTAVLGLKNLIVVTMDDAVLIADKSEASNLKTLVSKLKEKKCKEIVAHSSVVRPWGKYKTINDGDNFQVKHIRVEPGQTLSLQYHHHRSEHWTIVSGMADVTVGSEEQTLKPNDAVYIPIEAIHRISNPYDEPVELIEVQCGTYLGEDDIVRLEDEYGRIN
ncbi:MAG: mannose-1-phosphate guanylyltransferase/mannose-6-phosphate isomerase [Emcibacteraceae bacterium]|nr:mannose-1-phosphate guanylyltransferase/mannose-6-phosphate isomerase [Emcibacteraceae bacterium]